MASWPPLGERVFLGKSFRRLDGPDKAQGRARYAYDVARPGMLYARILGSPHAHARVFVGGGIEQRFDALLGTVLAQRVDGLEPHGGIRVEQPPVPLVYVRAARDPVVALHRRRRRLRVNGGSDGQKQPA